MWSTTGSKTNPTYPATLAAMKTGSDISGVTVSDFFLLSYSDAESVPQRDRLIYNESGDAVRWWLATPLGNYNNLAYRVERDGSVGTNYVDYAYNGIAPGFSISN